MGKEKRVLRVLALSLTGIFLLLLLWGLSPRPGVVGPVCGGALCTAIRLRL